MSSTISQKTIKQLCFGCVNRCSICKKILKEHGLYGAGDICHIRGEKSGSARYDPNMTPKERNSEKNLIVLCQNCHKLIDDVNPKKYTVKRLEKIKLNHESECSRKILDENPSFLLTVLKAINYNLDLKNYEETDVKNSFQIEDKITYNNVIRFRLILDICKIYQAKLQTLYNEIEKNETLRQEQFLNYIKHLYLEAKGLVLNGDNSIENIRSNADNLIDKVRELLREKIKNKSLSEELIYQGLNIIVVDMFMRCKILEEPK